MTTLDQLAQHDYVKLLVYGNSGSGKTCLSAGFPGPVLYLDFDHKISSAAKFYAKQPELLKNINVEQFAHLKGRARIDKLEAIVKGIYQEAEKGTLPYKTIVIDSLTTMSSSILEHYLVAQPGIKRALAGINAMQDYQLLDKQLTTLITGLLSLDCNVVMTGHLNMEKDETTGAVEYKPLMAGKFADKLPIYFEEVYVARVNEKGEYVLQTQSDHKYKCRSQRNHPKEIKSNYQAIKG